jgi:hypothetical protein
MRASVATDFAADREGEQKGPNPVANNDGRPLVLACSIL